jgi:hypothetical protein
MLHPIFMDPQLSSRAKIPTGWTRPFPLVGALSAWGLRLNIDIERIKPDHPQPNDRHGEHLSRPAAARVLLSLGGLHHNEIF